jgi:hypothetical protein
MGDVGHQKNGKTTARLYHYLTTFEVYPLVWLILKNLVTPRDQACLVTPNSSAIEVSVLPRVDVNPRAIQTSMDAIRACREQAMNVSTQA